MNRQEQAAALRAQLAQDAPDMLKFMDEMKQGFGAVVLYVKTDSIEQGKEQTAGVQPYMPLPSSTWGYEVGTSPRHVATPSNTKRKRK